MSARKQEQTQDRELLRKIKRLMFLRLLLATFLLIATAVVQNQSYHSFFNTSPSALYILTAGIYFLSFCYALLLKRTQRYGILATAQLLLDVVFVTALIYVTGGIESIFSFLYILAIISAAIILYRRGGLLIASASSILYGSLLDLQYFGLIHPFYTRASTLMTYSSGYYFYTVLMNISAFFAVAFLSSYLTEELRRSSAKLQAKQYDLDQLELLNRNIVQSIDSGLATLDNDLKITYVNRAAERISGFSRQEMQGRHISQIFPEVAPYLQSEKERGLDSDHRRQARHDVSFRHRNGNTLDLGFSQSVLKDPNGREFGLILIFQDLTEFRRMEEQMRRMDLLAVVGELAAGIAHEIKNPLASLSGSIQMLKDEFQYEPTQQRLMEIILREAERLNALANEFLAFSRPTKPPEHAVEVNRIIGDTLEMLQNSAEMTKSIRIHKELGPELWVKIDSQQLQQVLWNLVLNAIQEMENGGRLTIRTALRKETPGERDGMQAEISISDTGPGIARENQEKIFNPFFTTKEKGTGLGLTIVHRIVENYSGKIFFASDGCTGTTFTLYFPIAAPAGS